LNAPSFYFFFALFIPFALVATLALATIILVVLLENFFCNVHVNFLEINEIPPGTIIDPGTFLFQLIFDNYSTNPCSADASPASSFSKKMLINDNPLEGSSSKHLSEDLQELR
jgi:hypothetical protein